MNNIKLSVRFRAVEKKICNNYIDLLIWLAWSSSSPSPRLYLLHCYLKAMRGNYCSDCRQCLTQAAMLTRLARLCQNNAWVNQLTTLYRCPVYILYLQTLSSPYSPLNGYVGLKYSFLFNILCICICFLFLISASLFVCWKEFLRFYRKLMVCY